MLHVVWCMQGARLLPAFRTSTPYKLLIYRRCFMSSDACTELDYFPPSARALLTICWSIGETSCRLLHAQSSNTSRYYDEHSLHTLDLFGRLNVVWCMHGDRLLLAIRTSTPYKLLIYRRGFMSYDACTEIYYFPPLGRIILTNCWSIADASCRLLRARSSTTSRHQQEHSLQSVDL